MATLNIGGKRVKVDDSFLSLSPEQQQATVDEIAGSLGISAPAPEPQPAAPQQQAVPKTWAETGIDAAKGFGTGLVSGAESLIGGIGDAQQMTGDALSWAARQAGAGEGIQNFANRAGQMLAVPGLGATRAPRTEDISRARESVTGPLPKPETTAGQYLHTMGEFAPGAALGPGGLARKGLMMAVPAVASEAAGQATKGEWAEPFARVAGALAGGSVTAGMPGSVLKKMRDAAPTFEEVGGQVKDAYKAIDNAKIVFDTNAYRSMAMKLQNELRDHGLLVEQGGNVSGLLGSILNRARKVNRFTEIDSLRKDAGKIAFGGGATETEAARAKIIRKHLDDLVNKGKVISLAGIKRDEVQGLVGTARELARREIIGRDIENMGQRLPGYLSGDESAYRNQFGSYIKGPKGKGLNDAERQAFAKVVRREGPLNAAHMLGSRWGQIAGNSTGAIIGGALGTFLGGPVGTAIGAGLGHAGSMATTSGFRKLMDKTTEKQVSNALKTVLAGKDAQTKAVAASRKARDAARIRTLLAGESGLRSANEPLLIDARGNAYPFSLLGQ